MNVTRRQFDWSETRPSAAVTEYISAMTAENRRLPPLVETIDPEALDSLVDPGRSTTCGSTFWKLTRPLPPAVLVTRLPVRYAENRFSGPYTLICREFSLSE
ncbi:hypothetical protein C9J85_15395 [Haloferax sp. wsp5]|nr:hypothetical protein C9J85_15395 [Haloferax sp. wsp5]